MGAQADNAGAAFHFHMIIILFSQVYHYIFAGLSLYFRGFIICLLSGKSALHSHGL